MFYQEFIPSPPLQPYLERIWTLETGPEDAYPLEQIITPNGTEGWILSYRTVAQKFVLYDQPIPLPETYILVQHYTPWKVITEGCSGIVGVFFKAGSLHSLLKTPLASVMGHVIESQAFLGSQVVRCLLEQLAEASLTDHRIALVEKFFISCFCQQRLTAVQRAVQLIRQYQGRMSIEQLCGQLGIGRRTLEKQFIEKVGISPKHYSRVVRFNALQRYRINHPQTSWLDLAYDFGYFDQAHLIKDFYHFTGTSPVHYAAMDTFLADHFLLSDLPEIPIPFF